MDRELKVVCFGQYLYAKYIVHKPNLAEPANADVFPVVASLRPKTVCENELQNDSHYVIFLTNHNRVHKNPELKTRVAREAYECACKRKWPKMPSLACS